ASPVRVFLRGARRPPRSPLFPYTTLFRSRAGPLRHRVGLARGLVGVADPLDRLAQRRLRPARGAEVVELGQQDGQLRLGDGPGPDRKSTRLNSSHVKISYAVFCLKKTTNE